MHLKLEIALAIPGSNANNQFIRTGVNAICIIYVWVVCDTFLRAKNFVVELMSVSKIYCQEIFKNTHGYTIKNCVYTEFKTEIWYCWLC